MIRKYFSPVVNMTDGFEPAIYLRKLNNEYFDEYVDAGTQAVVLMQTLLRRTAACVTVCNDIVKPLQW